jgi:hypothetical protein
MAKYYSSLYLLLYFPQHWNCVVALKRIRKNILKNVICSVLLIFLALWLSACTFISHELESKITWLDYFNSHFVTMALASIS